MKVEIISYFFIGARLGAGSFCSAALVIGSSASVAAAGRALVRGFGRVDVVGSERGLAEASGLKNSQTSWSRLSATTMAVRSEMVGVVLLSIDGFSPSILKVSFGKSDII
jgi:hypothetical protein